MGFVVCFFFSSRRRHTRWTGDWSSDVCSSDLAVGAQDADLAPIEPHLSGDQGGFFGVTRQEDRVEAGLVDEGLALFALLRSLDLRRLGLWSLDLLHLAVALEVRVLDPPEGQAEVGIVGAIGFSGDDLPSEALGFFREGLGHLRAVRVPGGEDTQ